MRKPSLLGLDLASMAALADYYEYTMADTNVISGTNGREAVFNSAVRGLRKHKVVGEWEEQRKGKTLQVTEVEEDNYILSAGLEQILGFIDKWEMPDSLIAAFSDKGLVHKTQKYFEENRRLNLTIDAIPEGIPIFGNESFLSVQGTFEQAQFPESLILGTWAFQSAIATQASYLQNILKQFKRTDIVTLEGGSRRLYPGCMAAASRAALIGGFQGTSLVDILNYYPYLKARVGGSSGHSAVLYVGNDEAAFEMQLQAYYRIEKGDTQSIIKEKIRTTKGVGPTFLIDTFDSNEGLMAAVRIMHKYGIQCQVRNDSGDPLERVKHIRMTLNGENLPNAKIMVSDDLKPWKIYELLEKGADMNLILMGTYAVNPYRLPGPVHKVAQLQPDINLPHMVPTCKVSKNNPSKSTYPGQHEIYRITRNGFAQKDLILLRGVDNLRDFVGRGEDAIRLDQRVMYRGAIEYDFPDMLEIMEKRDFHMGLLKPEHKRFKGAIPYPVETSPTIKSLQRKIAQSVGAYN